MLIFVVSIESAVARWFCEEFYLLMVLFLLEESFVECTRSWHRLRFNVVFMKMSNVTNLFVNDTYMEHVQAFSHPLSPLFLSLPPPNTKTEIEEERHV